MYVDQWGRPLWARKKARGQRAGRERCAVGGQAAQRHQKLTEKLTVVLRT
jgi:hypothetical protein